MALDESVPETGDQPDTTTARFSIDGVHASTWVISAGRQRTPGAPLNVPPVLASNFYLPSDRLYSRTNGTETTEALEEILGGLDGGKALVFGSGMGAAAAVLDGLAVGSTIALSADPYHGVAGLADQGVEQGRWSVERIDMADTAAWVEAASRVDLLWLESPANPLLTVADLPAICAAPRKPGNLIAVDSTFATPFVQQPLELGADLVMHSATKFIGGHSDLLAGALVTPDEALYERLAYRRLLAGASIGGLEAFLAVRGARTLALRMAAAQSNAMELALRLDAHSDVTTVRYPGLVSHPTHAAAASFMNGYGAVMSFDVAGPGERADRVCQAAELINHATSLGGVESTMERRATIAGQETMPPTLIRFSVGCEDVDDIWSDLEQALKRSA